MILTPEEKAKELIERFEKLEVISADHMACASIDTRQCALIAIEFAKENPLNTDGYNRYLQQVKTEILNQTTK